MVCAGPCDLEKHDCRQGYFLFLFRLSEKLARRYRVAGRDIRFHDDLRTGSHFPAGLCQSHRLRTLFPHTGRIFPDYGCLQHYVANVGRYFR